jgi:hypothetical protein
MTDKVAFAQRMVEECEQEAAKYGELMAKALAEHTPNVTEKEIESAKHILTAAFKAGADHTLHRIATMIRDGARIAVMGAVMRSTPESGELN